MEEVKEMEIYERKLTTEKALFEEWKSMLYVLKNGTKNIERFLERCTVKIPCKHCYGVGCAQCSGYGYTREIIDKKRVYEV